MDFFLGVSREKLPPVLVGALSREYNSPLFWHLRNKGLHYSILPRNWNGELPHCVHLVGASPHLGRSHKI